MASIAHQLTDFIRSHYQTTDFIPLHAPTFGETEKSMVLDTIDSTYVSSVGQYVDQFEAEVKAFTGAGAAVATMNGTAALHTALHLSGVARGDLVITQALTFVATCNAIHQLGAEPVFIDVAEETLGLCPKALEAFLVETCMVEGEHCVHQPSKRIIRAIVPMHTFGHPVHLAELLSVCQRWQLTMIEDAAESLGSFYQGQHTGTIGHYGAISFNGNKIITTGGGGMVLCQDEQQGKRVKHVTTTAKVAHPYEFFHDEAGFNYRMPNLNAALGCAQMQRLAGFLTQKRALAASYREFFASSSLQFVDEPAHGQSNFWLNSVLCEDANQRQELLVSLNNNQVMCRPVWTLMHRLPMFSACLHDELAVAKDLEARLLNLPSSPG